MLANQYFWKNPLNVCVEVEMCPSGAKIQIMENTEWYINDMTHTRFDILSKQNMKNESTATAK